MPLRGCLCLVSCLLLVGCAKGSTSDPDGGDLGRDGAADAAPRDLPTPDAPSDPDVAAPDINAPDRSADSPLPTDSQPPDTQLPPDALPPDLLLPDVAPPPDLPPPDATAPDLCGPCGPGLICGAGGCVCDPATCTGCCTSDGSACLPGNTSALCGSNGVTCQPCQTSDPCQQASCGSGQCTISAHPNPPYPCPGAYGSPCGGSTGQGCLNGAPCATFVAGQTGFCSRYCTTDSNCTSNKPSGTSPACNLTAGSNQVCGFECFPGTCPSTMSCDFSEGLCKP